MREQRCLLVCLSEILFRLAIASGLHTVLGMWQTFGNLWVEWNRKLLNMVAPQCVHLVLMDLWFTSGCVYYRKAVEHACAELSMDINFHFLGEILRLSAAVVWSMNI